MIEIKRTVTKCNTTIYRYNNNIYTIYCRKLPFCNSFRKTLQMILGLNDTYKDVIEENKFNQMVV